MSYEVITVGEILFPSAADREAWRAKHDKLLADYADAKSYHPSMVYYLDLIDDAHKLTVRGLVHRDNFHPLVDALTNASKFRATGRIDFETTEGECHELVCDSGRGVYRGAAEGRGALSLVVRAARVVGIDVAG